MTLRCVPSDVETDELAIALHKLGASRWDYQRLIEIASAPPPPADIAEELKFAKHCVAPGALCSAEEQGLARALLQSWGRTD